MRDPFLIEGPAVISFSGGRTSGYMLWRILQAHGGTLPADVVVLFANTGKEAPATLDFVQACSDRWTVPVTWLEYRVDADPQKRWATVTYETAARDGAPFAALIGEKQFLPNPVGRFCTFELKIRPMKLYAQIAMGFKEWLVVMGLRADEPRRVARIMAEHREPFDRAAPLAEAGITVRDVSAFWQAHPFDLGLPNVNGNTAHGNCDLCFLKGGDRIASLIAEDPSRADWWIEQESRTLARATSPATALFRTDRPNYAAMKYVALHQIPMFDQDSIEDCACTD
jgi:3'-phosphoadenosine 5'-phosphosulfate sulfotransferase (PAPS reductase)/FAD synthetase